MVEVQFNREDDRNGNRALKQLPERHQKSSRNPPVFTECSLQTARRPRLNWSSSQLSLGEQLTSLSVQNTSLDDVFVHYTGRQFRDEQVKSVFHDAAPARSTAMNRMFAIVEREMRKFSARPFS